MWQRTATVLLALVPVLDLVLITATAVDLHRGGEVEQVHGIATFYLGFSIACGPAMIRWADVRFRHRFAGGPAPVKPPKGTPAYRRSLWIEWLRVLLAAAIAVVVLLVLMIFVADDAQRADLMRWIPTAGLVTGIWLLAGPVWGSFERPVS